MSRNPVDSQPPAAARPSPLIIPIASGKGGVGKSFLAANIAVALAEMGHPTIAADLDLGGSNLHSFLGLANRYPGVGDFIHGGAPALESLLVDTAVANLRFLPGDGRTPFLANLGSAQKQKLMRHLRSLPAEYLLLDLGAGTSFNTLDFFACAPAGLLVTTPDMPSVMGMQAFLKNHLLRCIDRQFSHNGFKPLRPLFKFLLRQPTQSLPASLSELKSRMMEQDAEAAKAFAKVADSIRPRVLFNMGAAPEESRIALSLRESLGSVLAIDPDFFGFVPYDPAVRHALAARKPFLPGHRQSPAGRSILKIAERIVGFWQYRVPDSAARMIDHALQMGAYAGLRRETSFADGRYPEDGQAWKEGAPRRLSYRATAAAVDRFRERARSVMGM